MKAKTSRIELTLILTCLALLLMALLGPAIAQPADHHHFADQRTQWGIPCTWDVLSKLPFAVLGFIGLGWVISVSALGRAQRGCAALLPPGHGVRVCGPVGAGLPVIAALRSAMKSGQNPAAHQKTKVAAARRLGNA